jgi:hypothetical protein
MSNENNSFLKNELASKNICFELFLHYGKLFSFKTLILKMKYFPFLQNDRRPQSEILYGVFRSKSNITIESSQQSLIIDYPKVLSQRLMYET